MSELIMTGLTFRGHPVCFFEEIPEPPAPTLPAYTIRLKFTEGVTPTFSKGTGTQVSSSPNVWDLTYENANWTQLLSSQLNLIEVIDANTTGVTNMSYMLERCNGLVSVALFDTSSVTNTSYMFLRCSGLPTVPFFDTSSVTDMQGMFQYCSVLVSVPVFNTSNVTRMAYMFQMNSSLGSVPLFNTTKVTNMYSMFDGCVAVQSGALALYQQASQGTVSTHTYAFTNCGINTVTGAAELAQIPSDWGGTGS